MLKWQVWCSRRACAQHYRNDCSSKERCLSQKYAQTHTLTVYIVNCADEICQTAAQFNTRFIAQILLQVKNKNVRMCACNTPGSFLLPIFFHRFVYFIFYCHGANNIDPDLARCFFLSFIDLKDRTNWFRHSNKYIEFIQIAALQIKFLQKLGCWLVVAATLSSH